MKKKVTVIALVIFLAGIFITPAAIAKDNNGPPEHAKGEYGPPENPGKGNGPPENPGEGNGPPENPGEGNGPPENPGEGNGPPENPGEGNGPPENPGEGNGPPELLFEQETYLFQKEQVEGAPWNILLPEISFEDDNFITSYPFAKLEYYNYPIVDEEGESLGFCFDLKGYGLPDLPEGEEYALIYYVDPGPGTWDVPPPVYVLGTGIVPWEDPRSEKGKENGEAKGLIGINLKIDGCCQIDAIPVEDDVNYPNGGKVWLIPTEYITFTETCSWEQMTGWPADVSEILFETSLITYGYVAEPDMLQ